jgi:hypothetical protein
MTRIIRNREKEENGNPDGVHKKWPQADKEGVVYCGHLLGKEGSVQDGREGDGGRAVVVHLGVCQESAFWCPLTLMTHLKHWQMGCQGNR